MSKSIFTLILINFIFYSLTAQLILKGKIENLPPASSTKIALESWSDDKWIQLDTFSLTSDKSFNKKVITTFAQVRLRIWSEAAKWIDFMTPEFKGSTVELDFGSVDYTTMDGVPAHSIGKESEAYYKLLSVYQTYRELRNKARASPGVLPDQRFFPLEKSKTALNDQCREIMTKNKGSYVGDILANILYIPVKSDYPNDSRIMSMTQEEFERMHLLDKIPFKDHRILLNNALVRAINAYLFNFSKTNPADMELFIDRLMSHRQGNEEVDAWLYRFLMSKFIFNKDDPALTYLMKWHASDCSEDKLDIDQNTKLLYSAFKNCVVGSRALDLTLPGETGENQTLTDLAALNKLTLIFIWRSDCSHCREFEPLLENIYKKYKPFGFGIIGIALDSDENKWKSYLAAHPVSWTNLRPVSNDQRVKLSQNFPIPGTPALICVDKNFIVKNRMINRSTFEEYLEQELKK